MAGETQHGKLDLGPNHQPIIRVPHGGSSCSSCKFVGDDMKTCKNKYYIQWNGSNNLLEGVPATDQCSDWYEPKSSSRWKEASR